MLQRQDGVEKILEEFVTEFFRELFSPKVLLLIFAVACFEFVKEELPDIIWAKLEKIGVV